MHTEKKYESFGKQEKYHTDRNMWFDGGVDVARYDTMKYPVFFNLTKEQRSFIWSPEEISLKTDMRNFKKMEPHLQHIFTSNIKRQILLDSVQGRAPVEVLMPLCSLPELESWIITWTHSEAIHSESYTYIIRALYNNPSEVFDSLRDIEEIEDCAEDVTRFYDDLANYGGEFGSYEHKTLLWKCINAINALEAVRFYVSFACTYAFGKNGILPGCADEIRLINLDEDLHRKGTTEMLKLMLRDDPDYVTIREECEEDVTKMFVDVIEQECAWADYLFKEGAMLGLTAPLLKEYVRWVGTRRMRSVGLKSPYTIGKSNPLPWVDEQINESAQQKSPQEEELTAYEKGKISQDFDPSNLGFDL